MLISLQIRDKHSTFKHLSTNKFKPTMNLMPTFLLILPTLQIHLTSSSSSINYTEDFGGIVCGSPPIYVLHPTTPSSISLLLKSISTSPTENNATAAPRGAGHSTYGQSPAPGGVVVDVTSLPSCIQVRGTYVDAGGGDPWVNVLNETLKHGLAPRSWTDYLYPTVGGTLSNGGIGGQAFKYGPQISNVIKLDVVIGKGTLITCSEHENTDLFYGVLGGLGQFGIITRARIKLEVAPKMVKRVIIPYGDFIQFTKGQELLISKGEVDYLEGFINLLGNSSSKNGSKGSDANYSIELALYYNDNGIVQKKLDRILSQLGFARSMVNESDVSYFEFLNRVRVEEEELRMKGLWEVAHPWLNLFVPRAQIGRFKDLLLDTISDTYTGGPILIYPILKHKWSMNMSAVLPEIYPEDDIVYVVSVLQSAPPSCKSGSQCLDTLLSKNTKIIDIATSDISKGGMGAKQYLPYCKNEAEWTAHFGDKWNRFNELKSRFDPLNILTPGQRIFKRKPIGS